MKSCNKRVPKKCQELYSKEQQQNIVYNQPLTKTKKRRHLLKTRLVEDNSQVRGKLSNPYLNWGDPS